MGVRYVASFIIEKINLDKFTQSDRMAQAQPAWKDDMEAAATVHWTDFNENATAEQKAVYKERYTKMQVDVEFRNTRMAEMTADWAESDANGDGKLNLEEFKVYIAKAKAREETAGCYVRPDPE